MDEYAPVEGGGQGLVESPSRAPKSKLWIWGVVAIVVVIVVIAGYYFMSGGEVEMSDSDLGFDGEYESAAGETVLSDFPDEVFTYIPLAPWENLGDWEKGETSIPWENLGDPEDEEETTAADEVLAEYYEILVFGDGSSLRIDQAILGGVVSHMSEGDLRKSFADLKDLRAEMDSIPESEWGDFPKMDTILLEEGHYRGLYSYTDISKSPDAGAVFRNFHVSKGDLVYSFEYFADSEGLYEQYLDDVTEMIDSSTAFS